MKSYEGNEPFLFVSYAHKDKELVYPVLEVLENVGCVSGLTRIFTRERCGRKSFSNA